MNKALGIIVTILVPFGGGAAFNLISPVLAAVGATWHAITKKHKPNGDKMGMKKLRRLILNRNQLKRYMLKS